LLLQTYPAVDKYVERLLEARKGKNLNPEAAFDAVTNDVNMFGVMMVASGEAAGMVSGAIHTTAATIRPAMQVRTAISLSSCRQVCSCKKLGDGQVSGLGNGWCAWPVGTHGKHAGVQV
jgi:phosphotransacetylase